jgi:hypothetical protein
MRAAARLLRVSALCATLFSIACDQPAMQKPIDSSYGAGRPQFKIVGDPASVADVPASQRNAEIRKAWEAAIERLPEPLREGAREEMVKGWVGVPISSSDPEIARLWSRMLSLRMAEVEEERRTDDSQRAVARQRKAKVPQ